MVHRLAIAFTVLLLATTPALAQRPGWQLELGGGWFQFNPLDIDDIYGFPSGPSVHLGLDEVAERADGHHRRCDADSGPSHPS